VTVSEPLDRPSIWI